MSSFCPKGGRSVQNEELRCTSKNRCTFSDVEKTGVLSKVSLTVALRVKTQHFRRRHFINAT